MMNIKIQTQPLMYKEVFQNLNEVVLCYESVREVRLNKRQSVDLDIITSSIISS